MVANEQATPKYGKILRINVNKKVVKKAVLKSLL